MAQGRSDGMIQRLRTGRATQPADDVIWPDEHHLPWFEAAAKGAARVGPASLADLHRSKIEVGGQGYGRRAEEEDPAAGPGQLVKARPARGAGQHHIGDPAPHLRDHALDDR